MIIIWFCHRRVVLALACLLAWNTPVFAQKPAASVAPSVKFGKITPEQFAYASADTTAEAEVMYDDGEVNYEVSSGDIWMTFTRHVRLRIRKKSAYERATIQLPVRRINSGQEEFVSKFEGYTYSINNRTITTAELSKAGHFTEKVSENLWLEKYTLPSVQEGAVLEYRYTIRSPFSTTHNPRTWRFQEDIPVSWSEYRINVPDYFHYKMMLGGYLNLDINEQKPSKIALIPGQEDFSMSTYRFAMKNVPAFRDEPYITTNDDYLSKLDFELASYQLPGAIATVTKNLSLGWEAMDKTLLDDADFGGQIKRASFLRETAKTLLSQHTDTLSRVMAAYEFIRKTITWNEEVSIWSVAGIRKAFDNKRGNAADINLMLIALLREMNVEANPVILSTRSHGRVDESYALLKKFNYVIAHTSVAGKDILLDATDTFLKPGMLPTHCLNGTGRLVHPVPSRSRFVSLVPVERNANIHTYRLALDNEGSLSGTLLHSQSGYEAWQSRKVFATEGRTKYVDGVRKKHTAWQVEKADFTGVEVSNGAFNETYTLAIPEACGQAGDRLYLRPLLTEARDANPFKEAERLYPVDFGVTTDETVMATYALPPGYQVEEMPKAVSMVMPNNGGRFMYQAVVTPDNQLQVVSKIILLKTLYFADDYPVLRELFSQIVAKHAEQIVLKRGTEPAKK